MPRTKQILPGGPRIADHVAMGVLAKSFPSDLVLQVVRETGKASIRNRDLPAHLVVLYCLSLWLYRDVAYEDVLDACLRVVAGLVCRALREPQRAQSLRLATG
jgi:hypothetical protein